MDQETILQTILSYEFNLFGTYYVAEVTGTFYKLTNVNKSIKTSVVYLPKV